ncbi:MAG: deoxyribonuclease IV [candidate division WOR-3 bacterium]|nr:MAG: deoxyribonuclease IV [candidate division WOR-3 bacterium]
MKLGFHISIAGGLGQVVARARAFRCATFQIFTRNPRSWKYKGLDLKEAAVFRTACRASRIAPVFIHMPYVINLASPRKVLFNRSVRSLICDLGRSLAIGAQFVIAHTGSGSTIHQGIEAMTRGINQALKATKQTVVLLENTPGEGREIGFRFEHLAAIINGIDDKKRIGVVLDTAHAFQAGYDLRSEDAVKRTFDEFDDVIGLERLHLVHFNDSLTEYGSCKDRHWHVGQGAIGSGMRYIIIHAALKNVPFIMETPRQSDADDRRNMETARNYLGKT